METRGVPDFTPQIQLSSHVFAGSQFEGEITAELPKLLAQRAICKARALNLYK